MSSLNIRIQNKYDTYENWQDSTLVLKPGEIAIAQVSSGDSTGLKPPAIGIKVGDGTKTFSQLQWIQSTAGDVYAWAKAADKPTYTADEITGLTEFVEGISDIDTNTQYTFSLDGNIIKVQKKDIGEEEFSDYQTVDLSALFNAKADKVVGAVEGNFAGLDANGNLVDSGSKAADFATKTEFDTLDTYVGEFTPVGEETTVVGYIDAKVASAGTAGAISIEESTPEDVAKRYTIKQGGAEVGIINIPKDLVVKSGSVKEVTEVDVPYTGAVVGEKYIELVIQNQDAPVCIPVKDLVDVYTAEQGATQVQLAIDASNVVSATIVAGSVGTTELSADVNAELAKAHVHENKDVLDTIDADRVAKWDSGGADSVKSFTGITATVENNVANVTEVPVTLLKNVAEDTLVLNCGNASEVI